MKIKPTSTHGVVVELGPGEAQLPGNGEAVFRLKRILVPVDFSDCSRKALLYGISFARQFGAELVLTNVLEPYAPVPELASVDWELILARMKEGGESALAKLRDELKDKKVRIRTELRIGRPDLEIVRAADELDVDLILLATHGYTGLKRVFLGSVAEHVTRYAHCPVLIVREREHEFIEMPVAAREKKPAGRKPRREQAGLI